MSTTHGPAPSWLRTVPLVLMWFIVIGGVAGLTLGLPDPVSRFCAAVGMVSAGFLLAILRAERQ